MKPNASNCVQGGGGSNFGNFCAYVLCGWPHCVSQQRIK